MFAIFSHPCTRVDVLADAWFGGLVIVARDEVVTNSLADVAINVLLAVVVSDVVIVVVVAVHVFCDICPDESVNISILLAFELSQAAPQRICANDFACQNM